MAIVAKLITCR